MILPLWMDGLKEVDTSVERWYTDLEFRETLSLKRKTL
jgi:hypothetical protein